MLVQVTYEDIVSGVQEDECECPVAKAIRRVLGKPCSVMEDGWVFVQDGQGNTIGHYQLSHKMVTIIRYFDKYGTMSPIEFELVGEPLPRGQRHRGSSR